MAKQKACNGCSPSAVATVAAMKEAIAQQPILRNPVIIDRIDSSRSALGKRVVVDMSGEASEKGGLHAHVRGVLLMATGSFTTALTTNGAVSSRLARAAAFNNISLVDGEGHYYCQGIDPRCVIDDTFIRTGALVQMGKTQHGVQAAGGQVSAGFPGNTTTITDDGLPSNTGAAKAWQVDVSTYFPFAPPRPRGSKHNPFAGLIPLSMLASRADALTFFIGGGSIPTAPASVVFSGVQDPTNSAGMYVVLDVVWLPDGIVADVPWNLDSYTDTQKASTLLHKDEWHEYCVQRGFEEDANAGSTHNGILSAGAMDGVTLTVGGEVVYGGQSRADLFLREKFFQGSDWLSAYQRANARQDLPVEDGNGNLQLLTLVPYVGRAHAAAGPIVINATSRDGTFSRYLHRTFKPMQHRPDRISKHARSAGITSGKVIATDHAGNAIPASAHDGLTPVIIAKHA